MPQISLNTGDRVFITGKTGSGKTYLAKYITKSISRLVVLDGKGTLTDWGLTPWGKEGISALMEGSPVRLRALPPAEIDPVLYWQTVLDQCYQAGNVTVYIDELYAVAPPNQQPPPALWALYTRGREFGIGVWAATQRPVWVPLVALSESEHYFMFRLTLQEDRNRLAAFMTDDVIFPIKDIHGFWYMRAEWDRPLYYQQLEVINNRKPGKVNSTTVRNQKILSNEV